MNDLIIGSLLFKDMTTKVKGIGGCVSIIAVDGRDKGDYCYMCEEEAKKLVLQMNTVFQLGLDTRELCDETSES